MAETKNPYGDWFKAFSDYRAPNFDMNAFFNIHRKNIEALSSATQLMSESFQALTRRQAEIAQNTMEEMLNTTKDVMGASSPEDGAAKQADYAKKAFQSSLDNVRELTEMASKSNVEAIDVISKRATESMDEFSKAAKKTKAAA